MPFWERFCTPQKEVANGCAHRKKSGSTKGETAGEQVSDAFAPNITSKNEPASDEKILQLV